MKDLKTIGLAKKNIKNKPGRTYGLMALTAILCFVLFMSSFLILSLKNGMNSLSHRLGADIIVVPEGYDGKITGAILRGEPNSFFFEKSVLDRINKIEGVEKTTPEFFLATLTASCCSYPIQIIGVDFVGDFTVVPWLEKQIKLPLDAGEIVVGSNVVGDYNAEVKFFNQGFKIKGRLAKTGMGFDNSVFMTMEEAKRLAKEYEKILEKPLASEDDYISSVMVKVKRDMDPQIVVQRIRDEFQGESVYPLASKSMMTKVSDSMKSLMTYVYVLIGLVWVLAFFVLSLVYSVSIKERKREFAMLRILGATKRKIKQICLAETMLINFYGALIGSLLAMVVSLLFSRAISASLKLPFLTPSWILQIIILAMTIIIGTALGPLSALFSLEKMDKREPALLLREND